MTDDNNTATHDGAPLTPPNKNAAASKLRMPRIFEERVFAGITAMATIAMVFYTSYLVSYGSRQIDIMNDQIGLQNAQLKRIDTTIEQTDKLIGNAEAQSKAAAKQAEQAGKANELIFNVSRVQYRSYKAMEDWVESTDKPSATFRNVGSTAMNVQFRGRAVIAQESDIVSFIDGGLDEEMDPGDNSSEVLGSTYTRLWPLRASSMNQSHDFRDQPFSKDDIVNVQAGRSVLWLSAAVFYKDIFGYPHRTRFCRIINLKRGISDNCKSHNDME